MVPKQTAKKRTWFAGKSDAEIREHVKKFRKLDDWIERNRRVPQKLLDKKVKKDDWTLKLTRKDVEQALREFKALDEAVEKSLRPTQDIDWKKWMEDPKNKKKIQQIRALRERIGESLKVSRKALERRVGKR